MKKLFLTVLTVSIFALLGSIGFGCGDDVTASTKTAPAAKCEMILELNSDVYPIDGVFYMPEIDAFVFRKPDLSEFTISRDSVASFIIIHS